MVKDILHRKNLENKENLGTLFSILAILIAYGAYCKSIEANKVANEYNPLVKINMAYQKDIDKQNLINNIINRIVNNWTKMEGLRANIITEWKNHNKNLTLQDFEFIWKLAYQRVKQRDPKKSFQVLLNESTKKG